MLACATISHAQKMREKLISFTKDLAHPRFDDYVTEAELVYKDKQKIEQIRKAKNMQKDKGYLGIIEEDMMHEISGDFDSKLDDLSDPLFSNLQMNYGNKDSKHIEVKNESDLKKLDFNALKDYKKLEHLDLSINALSELSSTENAKFCNLDSIKASHNHLRKFDPAIFESCPRLKVLQLDINELEYLPLPPNTNVLTKIDLSNNRISVIPKLTVCPYLSSLNLSKNLIREIPQFIVYNLFLTELILNGNQIEIMPKGFSMPMLKLLNLADNKLVDFRIAYCPMLEVANLRDNMIFNMGPLWGCPTLKSFDVSFNQIQALEAILTAFSMGMFAKLEKLKFNDNPFLKNRNN